MTCHVEDDISIALCACGCGRQTNAPHRFVRGHNAWKGGRRIDDRGYQLVYCPDHPRNNKNANKHRIYVREHILLAERALGRYLTGPAQVHHVNENRADNSPGNLVICENQKYHRLLHRRREALLATGDANAVRCLICHQFNGPDMSTIRFGRYERSYHRSCHTSQQIEIQRRKRKVDAMHEQMRAL